MTKRNYYLTFVLAVMLCANSITQLKAQETTEAPIDTLARAVLQLKDEVNLMKRLKITGYIQPQYQYIDSAGAPSVAGGDFNNTNNAYFSRFMMRRGRIKFTYEYNFAQFVLQTDVTEKGVFMRETYLKLTDPWWNMLSVTAGLFQDPFGFELTQSSSVRETPERARYNQMLFPVERDLGVMATIQVPKTMPMLYGIKLDVAVMNGAAGVAPEFDSHKDIVARLQYSRTTKNEKVQFAIGASYYHGGYRIGKVKDLEIETLKNGDMGFAYAKDTSDYYRVAKRNYIGADAQLSIDWKIGITTFRAEYIQGEQPGVDANSKSIGVLPTAPVYHRQFNGAYFYLIQNIGNSRFQAVLKYDWYDPNTKIAGTQVGKSGTGTKAGDVRFDTYGVGLNCRVHTQIKLTAYYDYVINENTSLAAYGKDIKDNVFTLRMQYKF